MRCYVLPVTEVGPSSSATIRKPATGLGTLPSPSEVEFEGLAPWSVITTRTLVASLRVDRGLFATWRCRGIGPAELPSAWFRPAPGRPRYYMVSDVLAWLAARRGETFETRACWLAWLDTALGPDCATPEWVLRLAENEGPRQGDVVFTARGWREYLALLSSR